MASNQKTTETKICGKTKDEIRKAFFKGKLKNLLNEIQSEADFSEEETKELGEYLESLRTGEDSMVKKIQKYFGGTIVEEEIKLPTVNELMEGIVFSKEEEEKVLQILVYIESELNNLRHNINKNLKLPPNYWLDESIKFFSFEPILRRYYIYKAQQYHAKITYFIDEFECSRLEAENRAHITKEYYDYKNLQSIIGDGNMTGLIERFENLSKKYEAKNN